MKGAIELPVTYFQYLLAEKPPLVQSNIVLIIGCCVRSLQCTVATGIAGQKS